MSTPKHTPVPWDYIISRSLIHVETANKGDGSPCGRAICSIPKSDEANARLIAAAPELLALVRWSRGDSVRALSRETHGNPSRYREDYK
jgi:hypothetical protein